MANKSSKSPSGEDREAPSEYLRKQEIETEDVKSNSGTPPSKPVANQENLKNRGFQEDQPHNPVRSTGSTSKDQEIMPTGEPDPDEV
jgi:hypothetical protein